MSMICNECKSKEIAGLGWRKTAGFGAVIFYEFLCKKCLAEREKED